MKDTVDRTEMRVYVGTYHKYNCGSLKGEWIDLEDYETEEEFYDYCRELHSDEEDPELMFQDYEGIPHHFISECGFEEGFFGILKEAEENNVDWQAFEVFLGIYSGGVLDAVSCFRDQFCGEYEDEEDYCYRYADDIGWLSLGIPEHYIDFKQMAHEFFHIGEMHFEDGYVFNTNA